MGSLISSRQEYPNLLQWGIWVPAQRGRSLYDLSFSEASRYLGKRTTYITIADAMVNYKILHTCRECGKRVFQSYPSDATVFVEGIFALIYAEKEHESGQVSDLRHCVK